MPRLVAQLNAVVAENVRAAITEQGLSAAEVSRRMKQHPGWLSRALRTSGLWTPCRCYVNDAADALGVPADRLLDRTWELLDDYQQEQTP